MGEEGRRTYIAVRRDEIALARCKGEKRRGRGEGLESLLDVLRIILFIERSVLVLDTMKEWETHRRRRPAPVRVMRVEALLVGARPVRLMRGVAALLEKTSVSWYLERWREERTPHLSAPPLEVARSRRILAFEAVNAPLVRIEVTR